ncbi:MAG: LpxD N-terminal domain-containing protein [Saprospiraceae bacterium]
MKLKKPTTIASLADKYNLKIIGDHSLFAYGINEIHKVEEGDITFVDAEKYYDKSIHSAANIILINKETECPPGKALLVCDNPFQVYNSIVLEHRPVLHNSKTISETAVIHPSAIIEPGAVISHHVLIGENSIIHSNAYIGEHSVIGKNVIIESNAIIGSDAFYYKKTDEGFIQWRSGGRTILHDNVRVGAGSTLNKGVSGDTIVHEGTKIDCQVHLGHGVVIGKNCLLAAQVGIGGKTIVGDQCVFYGQVGIAQNLTIGDNVIILAKSGVSKSLAGGKTYFGIPAEEVSKKYREMAAVRLLNSRK